MAARERGQEHDTRHPVMTEDMISRLPARRDGTGYAFILRDGLAPVIARPPIIWHGRWYKQFTRRAQRRYQAPAVLPQAPAGPDDLTWNDTVPQPARRALTGARHGIRPGRAPLARRPRPDPGPQPGPAPPARAARPWDQIGGGA